MKAFKITSPIICTVGAVCRSENDTIWGIEWPTVSVGSVATQNCPGLTESSTDKNGEYCAHVLHVIP